MALNGLICAEVSLRIYSLTHSCYTATTNRNTREANMSMLVLVLLNQVNFSTTVQSYSLQISMPCTPFVEHFLVLFRITFGNQWSICTSRSNDSTVTLY